VPRCRAALPAWKNGRIAFVNGTEASQQKQRDEEKTMLATILIVVLIMAIVGVLPRWSHSQSWGYAPTGGVGLILIIVVILLLLGRI
jgi:hypothetical protein